MIPINFKFTLSNIILPILRKIILETTLSFAWCGVQFFSLPGLFIFIYKRCPAEKEKPALVAGFKIYGFICITFQVLTPLFNFSWMI